MNDWLTLVLTILATWRLSHLVASEDGPFDLIARARKRAGDGVLGRLMDCPYCLSLWFAAPMALWARGAGAEAAVWWLAISGGACLIEQAAAALRYRSAVELDLPREEVFPERILQ